MDSNSVALIRAASGLERLMVNNRMNDTLRDSTVAQISAALYYKANVVARLTSNQAFQNKFREIIFSQIQEDFGNYIDAQARSKPKSLHHVYEWKRVGQKNARLFNLKVISAEGMSFKLDYEFKPSVSLVPSTNSRRRHTFTNKASIMEAGMPLKIAPRFAERLVFESDGITTFMPKGASVTVKRPGGPKVKNQFMLAYSLFFTGQLVNSAIKKSGFQQLFNQSMMKALNVPASIKTVKYTFSPNTIRMQADAALHSSFGGGL